MKRALVTGCYGQDGSFLSELLFQEGYEVHGLCKEKLSENSLKIRDELNSEGIRINLHTDSLYNFEEIASLIAELKPDVLFHMAAVHHSSEYDDSERLYQDNRLFQSNIEATSNILCACARYSKGTHIVTAGSCLMFDATESNVQDEGIPYRSDSMYGISKITEANLISYYRNIGLHASCAILYNHESHRRGKSYVTKKIADGLIGIKNGRKEKLKLGDISVQKDWGFAGDFARGMYLMATAENPGDYILSTGQLHSIEEYIAKCCEMLDLNNYMEYIEPGSVHISRKTRGQLLGIPSKAERELGWKREYSFENMVQEIVMEGIKSGN